MYAHIPMESKNMHESRHTHMKADMLTHTCNEASDNVNDLSILTTFVYKGTKNF